MSPERIVPMLPRPCLFSTAEMTPATGKPLRIVVALLKAAISSLMRGTTLASEAVPEEVKAAIVSVRMLEWHEYMVSVRLTDLRSDDRSSGRQVRKDCFDFVSTCSFRNSSLSGGPGKGSSTEREE